jgi:hypothetical protein
MNRVPRGLLSLIDSRTQGKNPDVFGDIVQPTFDMMSMIAMSKGYETVSASTLGVPVPSVGLGQVTVPNSEVWMVRLADASIVAQDATINARVALEYQDSASSTRMVLFETTLANLLLVGASTAAARVFHLPFLASGGSTFSTNITMISGVVVNGLDAQTAVNFVRLQV